MSMTDTQKQLAAGYQAEKLLEDLVGALDDTHWSSWQTTAKFSPALDRARDFLKLQVTKRTTP